MDTLVEIYGYIHNIYNGVSSKRAGIDTQVQRELHNELWEHHFKHLRAAIDELKELIEYCRESQGVLEKAKKVTIAQKLMKELAKATQKVRDAYVGGVAAQTSETVTTLLLLSLEKRKAASAPPDFVRSLGKSSVDLSRMVGRDEVRLEYCA